MNEDVLTYLRCPATKQELHAATTEQLGQLNTRIEAGEIRNRAGNRVERPVGGALVTDDGKLLYPIWDEIVTLLADEAIELNEGT